MRQKTFLATHHDPVEIGDTVQLIERVDILRGGSSYDYLTITDGVPGNADHSVRCYHGWRGTTCDIALYAHGLRKVIKKSYVTVFPGDIKVKLTVGLDLAPDKE